MKVLLVIALLAVSMLILIISIDLLMNFSLSGILDKEMRPFKLTDQTVIVILILFLLYFVLKAVVGFVKKKQGSKSP